MEEKRRPIRTGKEDFREIRFKRILAFYRHLSRIDENKLPEKNIPLYHMSNGYWRKTDLQ